MPKLLVILLIAGCLTAGECKLATVKYLDTTVTTSDDLSDPEDILTPKTVFGCVRSDKGTLLVIQAFRGNKPASTLVVPAGAVVSVKDLVDDDESKPRALPNARPEDLDEGGRPNDKRLV